MITLASLKNQIHIYVVTRDLRGSLFAIPYHWTFVGESSGHRWIPLTQGW